MREDGWGEVKAPGELGSLGLEADWQGCRLVRERHPSSACHGRGNPNDCWRATLCALGSAGALWAALRPSPLAVQSNPYCRVSRPSVQHVVRIGGRRVTGSETGGLSSGRAFVREPTGNRLQPTVACPVGYRRQPGGQQAQRSEIIEQ